jgi:hypothetical protein
MHMTYWCIALYSTCEGIFIHSGPTLCISSSWHCLHVRVKIDNTKVIKATASIAVIYSLRIVPIGTQFYGWRVYSGCSYLTTISDLRVAYIIAAGCLLRHADFLARILVQDIWQFKTLLNLFAAINPLASDSSSGFCR